MATPKKASTSKPKRTPKTDVVSAKDAERFIQLHAQGKSYKAIAAEAGHPLYRVWKVLAASSLTKNSATLKQRAQAGIPDDVVDRLKKVGTANAAKLATAIERDRTRKPTSSNSRGKVKTTMVKPQAVKNTKRLEDVKAAAKSA